MPATLTVLYPQGKIEHRLTDLELEVGDVVRRDGHTWVVTEVRQEPDGATTVTVRPAVEPEPDGSG